VRSDGQVIMCDARGCYQSPGWRRSTALQMRIRHVYA